MLKKDGHPVECICAHYDEPHHDALRARLAMKVVMMRGVIMGMLLPQHHTGDAHLLRGIQKNAGGANPKVAMMLPWQRKNGTACPQA